MEFSLDSLEISTEESRFISHSLVLFIKQSFNQWPNAVIMQ